MATKILDDPIHRGTRDAGRAMEVEDGAGPELVRGTNDL
jgi:hypothetical protein